MSKLIAVQGCTIKYEIETPDSGTVTLSATLSTADAKVKSGGNKAYKDKITITVISGSVSLDNTPSGASSGEGTVPPGSITIEGTSQKNTTSGDKFVLEDDEGSSTFSCIFPATTTPPGTIAYPVTIKAIVDDPGQNVVKVT